MVVGVRTLSEEKLEKEIRNLNRLFRWKGAFEVVSGTPLLQTLRLILEEMTRRPKSRGTERLISYVLAQEDLGLELANVLTTLDSTHWSAAHRLLSDDHTETPHVQVFLSHIQSEERQDHLAKLLESHEPLMDLLQREIVEALEHYAQTNEWVITELLVFIVTSKQAPVDVAVIKDKITAFFYNTRHHKVAIALAEGLAPKILGALVTGIEHEDLFTEEKIARFHMHLSGYDRVDLTLLVTRLGTINVEDRLVERLWTHIFPTILEKSEPESLLEQLASALPKMSKERHEIVVSTLNSLTSEYEQPLVELLGSVPSQDLFDTFLSLLQNFDGGDYVTYLTALLDTPNRSLAYDKLTGVGQAAIKPMVLGSLEANVELSLNQETAITKFLLAYPRESLEEILPLVEDKEGEGVRKHPVISVFLQHLDSPTSIFLAQRMELSFDGANDYYLPILRKHPDMTFGVVIDRYVEMYESKRAGPNSEQLQTRLGRVVIQAGEQAFQVLLRKLAHDLDSPPSDGLWHLLNLWTAENECKVEGLLRLLPLPLLKPKLHQIISNNLSNPESLKNIVQVIAGSTPVMQDEIRKLLNGREREALPLLTSQAIQSSGHEARYLTELIVELGGRKELLDILESEMGEEVLSVFLSQAQQILPYLMTHLLVHQSAQFESNVQKLLEKVGFDLTYQSFTDLLQSRPEIQESGILNHYFSTENTSLFETSLQKIPKLSPQVLQWTEDKFLEHPREFLKVLQSSNANVKSEPSITETIERIAKQVVPETSLSLETDTELLKLLAKTLPVLGNDALGYLREMYNNYNVSNMELSSYIINSVSQLGPVSIYDLIHILGTCSVNLVEEVNEALFSLQKVSVKPLLVALTDQNSPSELVQRVERLLLQSDEPSIIPEAIQLFPAIHLSHQQIILERLLVKKILQTNAHENEVRTVLSHLSSNESSIREGVSKVAKALGRPDIVISVLMERFTSDELDSSLSYVGAVTNLLAFFQPEVIDELLRYVGASDRNLRSRVTMALVKVGEPAVKALLEKIMEEDYEVQKQAAEILGALGEPAVQPILTKLTTETNVERKILLIHSLGQTKTNEAVFALVEQLTTAQNLESTLSEALQKTLVLVVQRHDLPSDILRYVYEEARIKERVILQSELPEMQSCATCGRQIISHSEYCSHCSAPQGLPRCLICSSQSINQPWTQCPHCLRLFHGEHLRSWVENHRTCPACRRELEVHYLRSLWICPSTNCSRVNDGVLPNCPSCGAANPFFVPRHQVSG